MPLYSGGRLFDDVAKYRPTRVGQQGEIGNSGSAADIRVNEMRYLENKERSTEILRLALPLMARQLAAFHPLSYALWYEHCAGMNPDLSRILDSRLSSNTALSEADVWRLYAQHIAARDMEAFERLQLQLRTLLEDTAQSAASAGQQAAEFGHSLQGHAKVLADPQGPEKIREIVADMLVGTQKMQTVTTDLSTKLQARTNEVNALTESLRRAQRSEERRVGKEC